MTDFSLRLGCDFDKQEVESQIAAHYAIEFVTPLPISPELLIVAPT